MTSTLVLTTLILALIGVLPHSSNWVTGQAVDQSQALQTLQQDLADLTRRVGALEQCQSSLAVSSWSEWGAYSSCSKSCGGGTQERERTCRKSASCGGDDCTGASTDSRSCNTQACPDTTAKGFVCAADHPCGQYGYKYYWCWRGDSHGQRTKWWDYCCQPDHACAKHGYSYNWCRSGKKWTKCKP